MNKQRLISSVLLAALLSGCSMIPNYERPAVETPASWSEVNASEPTQIAKDWWKQFNSAELNSLMEQALVSNTDIGMAVQRVEQARGTLRSTGSSLLPSVDGTGGLGYERRDPGQGKTTSDPVGNVGLGISYELDIFGKNRARTGAASARLQASEYDRDAIALIIMGDVAQTYFNVLNLQERLAIADKNLESAQELLRIVQARFDAGATTLLDVSQQKSDLASTEASRALLEQQTNIARTALAVLVGKAPQNFTVSGNELRTLSVPQIAPGQPSTLLERRPDIRAAEANLIAANADIGAARAAFFPSITLGLDASILASPLHDPATTVLSLASGLVAPIFKGGLLQGNLDTTNARKLELVENYRKVVLVSFKEVEDALTIVKTSNQREMSLETAMNEARNAYNLSVQQYDAGAIDFQTLLIARQTMYRAEDAFIQTKNERLASSATLFKALGGGWSQEASRAQTQAHKNPPPPEPARKTE
jgi:multidrug efflux system outer membrane protein